MSHYEHIGRICSLKEMLSWEESDFFAEDRTKIRILTISTEFVDIHFLSVTAWIFSVAMSSALSIIARP